MKFLSTWSIRQSIHYLNGRNLSIIGSFQNLITLCILIIIDQIMNGWTYKQMNHVGTNFLPICGQEVRFHPSYLFSVAQICCLPVCCFSHHCMHLSSLSLSCVLPWSEDSSLLEPEPWGGQDGPTTVRRRKSQQTSAKVIPKRCFYFKPNTQEIKRPTGQHLHYN